MTQVTQAFGWTDDRVEQLKNLWTEGLSAAQISRAIGGGLSRNAVIGKVHRLGLAGRASPARRERPRLPAASKPSLRPHLPPAPIVEEDPLVLEDGNHATVLTVNDRMCRWPIGDPASINQEQAPETFHFCGRSPRAGSPYCEAHARKAYQPLQQYRRRDKGRMAG